MRRFVTSSVCAAIALSGCTSNLAVKKIDIGSTAQGYPYQLRYTQFEIALAWRVTACKVDEPNGLKMKISADITAKTPLDPDQLYSIDPASLQGPFRATEFSMEWYEDRGTKSVNSTVDDQTGPAIINVLTGIGKLAGAGLLPAGGSSKCSDDVLAALKAINGVKDAAGNVVVEGQDSITKKAVKAVEEQTAVLTRLTARAAALGATVDDQTRNDMGNAQRLLEALKNVLTLEQGKLKSLLEDVTDTRTITWPGDGLTFESKEPIRPSAKAMEKWSMNSTSTGADIYLRLIPKDGQQLPSEAAAVGPDGSTPTPDPDPSFAGLPYREPRAMRLYICSPAPCAGTSAELEVSKDLVKTADAQVFQGGTTFYLPFKGRTFASIKNSAGFAQSGVLTTAGSNQPRGAGSGAAETFKGAAEQVAAIKVADRTAETARLTALTEEAKAKKALADAQAALVAKPVDEKQALISAYQTDATLATAERTKIEAEAALALARQQQAQ